MYKKINEHGIISMILFFAAITLSIIAMLRESTLGTIIYLIFLLLGFISVIYSYCTKCTGRFHCGHIIIGKIAQRFPKRSQTLYTQWDYIGVIIPLLIILLFPQLFLFKIKWMFFGFWLLTILAVIEIKLFVCTKCPNSQCVSCKKNYTNTH
jgi:hypothetical protein